MQGPPRAQAGFSSLFRRFVSPKALGRGALFLLAALPLLAGSDLRAQTVSFGKNKIQYTDFQWRVLKSPHFDLYFYPEEESLATMALQMAEDSFGRLAVRFAYHVDRRIPLIIYSSHQDFEQTNVSPYFLPEGVAGFTEFVKGRVAIPFDGSIASFKHTIHHELVHVYQLAILESVFSRHYRGQPAGAPLWLSEGMADLWSEKWDGTAEMVLRDLVLSNELPSIPDLWRFYGSFTIYKVGQDLAGFIEREYGEDAIPRLYDNLWKAGSFDGVLQAALGVRERELSERWHRSLKLRYYPEIETATSPANDSKALAVKGGANFKPCLVPPSAGLGVDRFLFISPRTGYTNIYMASTQGEEREVSVVVQGERTPEYESLHPFRNRIDVSPDGRLAFTSKFHERDALFLYDLKEKKEVGRFQFKELIGILSPSQSPDGKTVVFSGLSADGHSDLYLFHLADSRLERLTEDWYQDIDPAFSRDGRRIAFSSDRTPNGHEGTRNIFIFDRLTGKIRAVTRGDHEDSAPAWSHKGDQLAFVSDRSGTPQIHVSDLEGVGYRVTSLQGGALDPEWLPDDRGLLYAAYHRQRFGVYRLDKIEPEEGREVYNAPLAASLDMPGPAWGSLEADSSLTGEPWTWESGKAAPTAEKVPYRSRFTLDLAQGGVAVDPGLGSGEGLQALLSDQLGDQLIFLQLSNTAETTGDLLSRFNVGATYFNVSRRFNYGLGVYHFAGDFLDERDFRYFERRAGIDLVGSYPFSKFKRIESSLFLYHSDRSDDSFRPARQAILATNYLSLVHDNSLWLPTGPIDGGRYNLTIGVTTDLERATIENVALLADFRRYYRVGLRSAYAVRLQGRVSEGTNRQRFVLGGSGSLRGFPRRSLFGSRSLLLNNEFRFPLLEGAVLGFPFGNIGLPGVQGAILADVGNAWEEQDDIPTPYGSFGVGLRSSLGGFLVLRLDFVRTTDFKSVSSDTDTDFFIGFNY